MVMLQPTQQTLLRKLPGAGGEKCYNNLSILPTSLNVITIDSQTQAGVVWEMRSKQTGYLNSSSAWDDTD
jgi:hypothetical protein